MCQYGLTCSVHAERDCEEELKCMAGLQESGSAVCEAPEGHELSISAVSGRKVAA